MWFCLCWERKVEWILDGWLCSVSIFSHHLLWQKNSCDFTPAFVATNYQLPYDRQTRFAYVVTSWSAEPIICQCLRTIFKFCISKLKSNGSNPVTKVIILVLPVNNKPKACIVWLPHSRPWLPPVMAASSPDSLVCMQVKGKSVFLAQHWCGRPS